MKPQEGTYVISEVGDLGLGLTPVNESEIERDEESEKDNQLI